MYCFNAKRYCTIAKSEIIYSCHIDFTCRILLGDRDSYETRELNVVVVRCALARFVLCDGERQWRNGRFVYISRGGRLKKIDSVFDKMTQL